MQEKLEWADTAATAFKEVTKCDLKEQHSMRAGWLFGFDACKVRIDKRLASLSEMLNGYGAKDAVKLVKDIRESIKVYGEGDSPNADKVP